MSRKNAFYQDFSINNIAPWDLLYLKILELFVEAGGRP